MKELINLIKESIVFLGYIDNGIEKIIGTGVLIRIDGINHLVTAKHVVEKNYENLFAFLNSQQFNAPKAKPLNQIYKDGFKWITHKNKDVDIALIPFLSDPSDKIKFIDNSLIEKNIHNINELHDVFYLSYQPGLNDFRKDGSVNPIIRKGVISRVNNNDTFFIDGFAFPGNSGSPVFSFPNLISFNQNKISIGGPIEIKLIGIVGAYISYQDIAISQQTSKPKVIFDENTGLSLIYSTKFLDEITQDLDFKNQLDKLKQKIAIQNPNQPTIINQPNPSSTAN